MIKKSSDRRPLSDGTGTRQEEETFRALIENSLDVVLVLDADAKIRYASPSASHTLGYAPEVLLGRLAFDLVHPEHRSRLERAFRRATRQPGGTISVGFRVRKKDGTWRFLEGRGRNLLEDPRVGGLLFNGRDITEQKRIEDGQRFLTEASSVLAGSLDYEETLHDIVQLAVPALADWCAVDILTDDDGSRRLAAAHRNSAYAYVVRNLVRHHPPAADVLESASMVEGAGGRCLVPVVTEQDLREAIRDIDHLAKLEQLGLDSLLRVPLVARGKSVGALTFAYGDSGRSYGMRDLAFAEDLGRRAGLAIENARLYTAAVEAGRAKADFLAAMSHDLKTPIAAIMGYTDLLETRVGEVLGERETEHFDRIRLSSRYLLDLVDQVLEFSRLEAGRASLSRVPVDLRAVAREVAEIIRPLTEKERFRFRVDVCERPVAIETDPGKLRQIVLNLLSNAVKFTEEGEVALRVPDPQSEGAVLVQVEDTGIGIPPEHLDRIFEAFWQVSPAGRTQAGGAGLGLSLARRMARLLGGDIHVESMPGEGSVFTLRLTGPQTG